jgi:hypothetical protein
MGELNVSTKSMLALDLTVFALIVLGMRQADPLNLQRTELQKNFAFGSLIAVGALIGNNWFNAMTSVLILDSKLIDVGIQHNEGIVERHIWVTNRTMTKVRLLSVSPQCSVRVKDIGWAIEPQMSRVLTLEIPVRGTTGAFRRRAEIYFDCPDQTKVEVFVTGRFQPSI